MADSGQAWEVCGGGYIITQHRGSIALVTDPSSAPKKLKVRQPAAIVRILPENVSARRLNFFATERLWSLTKRPICGIG